MSNREKILSWLEQAGVKKLRVSGDNAVCTCPFHDDTGPSFAMHVESGLFICYSGSCGVTGNLINFLISALGYSFTKARKAADRVGHVAVVIDKPIEMPSFQKRHDFAFESVEDATVSMKEGHLGLYDFCPKYMLKRGFSKKVLKKWEVGFDYGVGRVTFPVRDRAGTLVGISKRAVDAQLPTYLHLGFSKGSHLYGMNRVPSNPESPVVVVEGQADVLAWDQMVGWGYPVGTMGSQVSDGQVKMLSALKRVVLAFDNPRKDAAGYKATIRVGDQLVTRMRPGSLMVLVRYPPKMKDPGDLLMMSHHGGMGDPPEIRDMLNHGLVEYNQARLELTRHWESKRT